MKIRIKSIVNFLFFIYYLSLLILVSNVETVKYTKILLVLLLGTMLLTMLKNKKALKYKAVLNTMFPFLLFCFLSIIWSMNKSQALTTSITMAQMFILVIVIYGYYSVYSDIEFLIWTIVFAGVVMSAYCIAYYGVDAYIQAITVKGRLGGDIANANALAVNAATSTVGCFYYGLYKGKKIYYGIMLIPITTILGTSSRTGFLIAIIGIFFIVLSKVLEPHNVVKTIGKVVFTTIIIFVIFRIIMQFLPNTFIFTRLETLFNFFSDSGGKVDGSTLERMQMIELGKRIFYSSPLFGIGIDNARVVAQSSGFWNTYLHNNFIELLADVGVIGFSLFYLFYAKVFIFVFKKRNAFAEIKSNNSWFILLITFVACKFIVDYGSISYYVQSFYVLYAVTLLGIDQIENHCESIKII